MLPFLAAALLGGAFVCMLLPAGVTTLNDDFGYYRSIVETLQHGRPWTDDWLEPWAASLSALSALIFSATGSFYLATYGLQSLLAAAGIGLTCVLLRERGHSTRGAILTAGLFFIFPTILWKLLEFTGVVLYWPCLLAAILSADRRRWGWFFVAYGLAVASRQSALAWLVLPGWACATSVIKGNWRSRETLRPALTAVAGLVVFGLMTAVMNKTHAQTVITDRLFAEFEARRALIIAATGALAFVLAGGGSALLLRLQGRLRPLTATQALGGVALIIVAAAVLRVGDPRQLMKFEHNSFAGPLGGCAVLGLFTAAILGWVGGGVAVKPRYLVYAGFNLLLISLRPDLWDYYLGDLLIFGLLAVSLPPTEPATEASRATAWPRHGLRMAGFILITAGVAYEFWCVLQFKLRLDRAHATNSIVEQAFRQGQVTPHQFYGASFGYIAWHLDPYFIAHEGAHDPHIAHFWNYLLYSIDVRTKYLGWLGTIEPFKSEYPAEPRKLITSEVHPVWWIFRARFTLERATPLANPPPHIPMRLEEYRRVPFPLNDGEWRELIAHERL